MALTQTTSRDSLTVALELLVGGKFITGHTRVKPVKTKDLKKEPKIRRRKGVLERQLTSAAQTHTEAGDSEMSASGNQKNSRWRGKYLPRMRRK